MKKRMSESALTRITTRFGTRRRCALPRQARFATKFARLNPEVVNRQNLPAGRAKVTATTLVTLSRISLANLVDSNTLNISYFY